MRKVVFLSMIAFLGACSFGGEKWEITIAGKITKVDVSEEMIWVDSGRTLYVKDVTDFTVGDIVRITFTDPTETDDWNPDDFEVIEVEFLDDGLYGELREIAWTYLPEEIKESAITRKGSAQVMEGISSATDPNVELEDETMDNRSAWEVSYYVSNSAQPYVVIIDQETLEVLGLKRPEN